ncbi:MAG TPA: PIG-L family deacetylase [Armatimonadota bacterium]|jgi:LmbE family N-acetylglucosaminyl deacetylase
MQFKIPTAGVYVPDEKPEAEALSRTTHMGISAHQDDIEIMAMEGVINCFGLADKWFAGVIVTNGAGSARDDMYANYTDAEMQKIRRLEQKKAAFVGEYGAQVFLDFPSSAVKDPAATGPVEDLAALLLAARPEIVYTHNLADKHPTHIGTAMKVLAAIRSLPRDKRPKTLLGCEVWRDLDWMIDADKHVMRLDAHENIQTALVSVFDSQVVGGKRYDLATMGRRRAHATYHESHAVDASHLLNFAMDLTPLIEDDTLSPMDHVLAHIERFTGEVKANLAKFA